MTPGLKPTVCLNCWLYDKHQEMYYCRGKSPNLWYQWCFLIVQHQRAEGIGRTWLVKTFSCTLAFRSCNCNSSVISENSGLKRICTQCRSETLPVGRAAELAGKTHLFHSTSGGKQGSVCVNGLGFFHDQKVTQIFNKSNIWEIRGDSN